MSCVVSEDVPRENWIWDEAGELVAGPVDCLPRPRRSVALMARELVVRDRVREVDARLGDKLAVLPLFERGAERGRREEAPLPVVAEGAGRNEIGMVIGPAFTEWNVMVTNKVPNEIEFVPTVEAFASGLGEDQVPLPVGSFTPLFWSRCWCRCRIQVPWPSRFAWCPS